MAKYILIAMISVGEQRHRVVVVRPCVKSTTKQCLRVKEYYTRTSLKYEAKKLQTC